METMLTKSLADDLIVIAVPGKKVATRFAMYFLEILTGIAQRCRS